MCQDVPSYRTLSHLYKVKNFINCFCSFEWEGQQINYQISPFVQPEYFKSNIGIRKCNLTQFHRTFKKIIQWCVFIRTVYSSQFRGHYFQLSISVFWAMKNLYVLEVPDRLISGLWVISHPLLQHAQSQILFCILCSMLGFGYLPP